MAGPVLPPEAAIAALQELKAEAADPGAIHDGGEGSRSSWRSRVSAVVDRALGPDSEIAAKLRENSYSLGMFTSDTPASAFRQAFVRGVERAVGYIDAAIFELGLIAEADLRQAAQTAPNAEPVRVADPDPRAVFVVHGRNEAARVAMFDFLRSLGLLPIEWQQAVNATGRPTPYIGEVLRAAFGRAQAVLVLITPDDEGRLRDKFHGAADPSHDVVLTPQPRLNVIFEAGMAMAWDEDRTVIVELGRSRPFSDIAGRHVLRLDNSSQRRQELAQRLLASKLAVDISGTDWHAAGDFDAAVR
jgi:predicted nucleotide-binding protein